MRRISIAAAALCLVSTTSGGAPEDAIRYRQAVMTAMSGHVAAISLIFSGKVEHQQYLLSHAEALAATADQVSKVFPSDSATGKTRALPLIWQEPEKFQKATEAIRAATGQLRDAVKGGDKAAIGQAMKPVFDACKGCHDRYRKEDEKKT
jgi:cytochrome c556